MDLLVPIGSTGLLLAAFLVLTAFEKARGTRFFGAARGAFDREVDSAFTFLAADSPRLLRASAGALDHMLHTVAHGVLQAVRLLERMLTRIVRAIRARRGGGGRIENKPE